MRIHHNRLSLIDLRLWRGEEFRIGLRDMFAASPGIAAWALVTGVAMAKSGLDMSTVVAMSALVFAASAQLAAMPLMLLGAPLWVIWATAVCVNLRFVIFSTQMRSLMMPLPLRWRLLAGYLTADMTFAMMVRRYGRLYDEPRSLESDTKPLSYFVGLSAVNWSTWNLFSLCGVFLADGIPVAWGLELAGGLALLGLLATLANDIPKILIAVVAAILGLMTYDWPYRLGIVFCVSVAIVMGGLWDHFERGVRNE